MKPIQKNFKKPGAYTIHGERFTAFVSGEHEPTAAQMLRKCWLGSQ